MSDVSYEKEYSVVSEESDSDWGAPKRRSSRIQRRGSSRRHKGRRGSKRRSRRGGYGNDDFGMYTTMILQSYI